MLAFLWTPTGHLLDARHCAGGWGRKVNRMLSGISEELSATQEAEAHIRWWQLFEEEDGAGSA